jgi:hypothetical protein
MLGPPILYTAAVDDKEMHGMYQHWVRLVLVPGLLSLWPCFLAQAQPLKSIGQVTALEGTVTVLRQGKFAPELLTLGKPVFQEDIIETDRASKVRVTLIDASVVSLAEQTRLELKQFSYDTRRGVRTGRLGIASGFFRAVLRAVSTPSAVEITTPTAVAAIRGTDLMGEITSDTTAIVVLDGTVEVSNVRQAFRGLSTLTPGMGTTVKRDEPPSTPTRWSEGRIEGIRRATALP